MRGHVAVNEESRAELVAVVETLTDAELCTGLEGGWTVASALAHLAFWDRLLRVRWEVEIGGGMRVGRDAALAGNLLNDSVDGLLRTVDPRLAAAAALDEAAALYRLIRTLPEERLAEAEAGGYRWAFDRSIHRREHIDQIRRAIGGADPSDEDETRPEVRA